jgi:neuropeptide FF receptor 2
MCFRYLAIFCPQKKIITPQRAGIIILMLWLLPMVMQVPWAIFQRQITVSDNITSITACIPNYPSKEFERSFFLGVVFLMLYLLPLCFLVVFYSMIGLKVWQRNVSGIRGSQTERNIQKQKIRIVRMLITVAVVFALAWLPIYAIRMRIYYGPPLGVWERDIVKYFLNPIAQWMGSATSAVNPFIYCYFSEQFRKNIIDLLSSSSCCKRLACNSIGMQRIPTEAVKV